MLLCWPIFYFWLSRACIKWRIFRDNFQILLITVFWNFLYNYKIKFWNFLPNLFLNFGLERFSKILRIPNFQSLSYGALFFIRVSLTTNCSIKILNKFREFENSKLNFFESFVHKVEGKILKFWHWSLWGYADSNKKLHSLNFGSLGILQILKLFQDQIQK